MSLNISFTAGFDPLPTIQGDNVTLSYPNDDFFRVLTRHDAAV